jgi:hypothetical protein
VPTVLAGVAVGVWGVRASGPSARTRAGLGALAIGTFAVTFGYSTFMGGDFLGRRAGWDRFTAPALPLLVVGLSASLSSLPLRSGRRYAVSGVVLFALLFPAIATPSGRKLLSRRLFSAGDAVELQAWVRSWRRYGMAVGEVSRPGARLATCSAGAVVYFSGRGGVDLLGKVDPFVARLPVGEPAGESRCWRDWPGHNKEAFAETFALRRPELSAVAPPRALRRDYRPVRYEGLELWVDRTSPLVRWDVLRLAPGWPEGGVP